MTNLNSIKLMFELLIYSMFTLCFSRIHWHVATIVLMRNLFYCQIFKKYSIYNL